MYIQAHTDHQFSNRSQHHPPHPRHPRHPQALEADRNGELHRGDADMEQVGIFVGWFLLDVGLALAAKKMCQFFCSGMCQMCILFWNKNAANWPVGRHGCISALKFEGLHNAKPLNMTDFLLQIPEFNQQLAEKSWFYPSSNLTHWKRFQMVSGLENDDPLNLLGPKNSRGWEQFNHIPWRSWSPT